MKRSPAVAGRFYSGGAGQLTKEVEQYTIRDAARDKVIGAVSPHAGLMYSGHVAGALYSSIAFPKTFLILGPNHTGRGAAMSIMSAGEWEIPSAIFSIDENLSRRLSENIPLLAEDMQAQMYEHSIEVQLPFISHAADKCMIVPVMIGHVSIEECVLAGKGIASAIREVGYDVVIIASSDMSHYENDADARRLDGMAIKKVMDLDPAGLYSTVVKEGITMCGFIPATIMLYAAIELGAKEARLVKYATSGEVSGDFDRVVGYAGITIK
jgi:AmmeMemoRadiSam system protein B